ncbi:MAG: ATP-dependent helicase HrpB [Myxococcota bacterium]|jgi:ATP-dependent helicase HrpB
MSSLPIDALRESVLSAIERGPVVLSAPTGSGKSTQVPRWLRARGRALVVEPRRVAARALASRVAELEQSPIGGTVGYAVRDERRASAATEVLFVTPGIALRMLRSGDDALYSTLVLDEFHERSLDLDLLLALALERGSPELLIMSATLQGDRIARHLGGEHLSGEGRLYPVDTRYLPSGADQPDVRGLESRVQKAADRAASDPGDILVFLPGKGEIASVQASLQGDFEVLALHGGLSLSEQSRVFKPGKRRRIILSTNVAETSLTVPRIGVVIDTGLVRRTQYHHGRGYLSLMPIARDSADQRAGRAGRLGPGVCYRLWPQNLRLDDHTPPEIHRESLVPLLLSAAACGADVDALRLLDPPHDYALEDARSQLALLGALDDDGRLTAAGEDLFGLPLDAHLGRLLIEARRRGTLPLVIPLVAALATPRRLLLGRPDVPEDDLRARGCDAEAMIQAVQSGDARRNRLDRVGLREARQVAKRLRRIWSVPDVAVGIDRRALAETLLGAWPDCAHLPRRRRRAISWSNGGTELSLGREVAIDEDKVEALLLLESRGFGVGARKRQLVITAAMPVPLRWLVEAGLGRDRLAAAILRDRAPLARTERVYAGAVIDVREEAPVGAMAQATVCDLIFAGRLMPGLLPTLQQRHATAGLAAQLSGGEPLLEKEAWLLDRLALLGLQSGDDLALIEPEDLLPDEPPMMLAEEIRRSFPLDLSIGDARYHIDYDVTRRIATLRQVSGLRKSPPPEHYLPSLPGWRLQWEHKNRVRSLRG